MINFFFSVELVTRTLRTIYVEREDPESRMKAAEEIRRRTHTRGEWPKVLIFPEGKTKLIIIINFYAKFIYGTYDINIP